MFVLYHSINTYKTKNRKHVLPVFCFIVNSFRLLGFKRKLEVFAYVEDFFELHSRATEGKKDENRAENSHFLAN
ncbi:hypothetical protein GCM10022396_00190 [Flavivirga amylovorans]